MARRPADALSTQTSPAQKQSTRGAADATAEAAVAIVAETAVAAAVAAVDEAATNHSEFGTKVQNKAQTGARRRPSQLWDGLCRFTPNRCRLVFRTWAERALMLLNPPM